ncbi:MAG: P27 family phage terminase small subunit [Bacteroidota bacterium]
MNIVGKQEKGKVIGLDNDSEHLKELPRPPAYLDARAKAHYRRIGELLITKEKLKSLHLPALELLAENFKQWEWAVREIRDKNKKRHGSGYIQKYSSGAKNISVEITLKRDAEKAIMQCFKQFGLDPKSEKELGSAIDPNQLSLFEEFLKRKQSS